MPFLDSTCFGAYRHSGEAELERSAMAPAVEGAMLADFLVSMLSARCSCRGGL